MKTNPSILIFGLLAIVSLAACNYTYSSSDYARNVSVTGHGEVYVVPDVAYVNIGVQNTDDLVTAVLNQNTTQAQGIRTALTKLGVADVDIQTSNFSIYPVQQYDNMGNMTGTKYQAVNTVSVTIRDLSKLGQILDAVVRNGANTVNSISFDVLDKTTAITEARSRAVKDAQSQAQELANASGAQLGEVQSISVSSSTPVPVYEGKGGGGAYAASSAVPVATGQLVVSVDVYISWELKSK